MKLQYRCVEIRERNAVLPKGERGQTHWREADFQFAHLVPEVGGDVGYPIAARLTITLDGISPAVKLDGLYEIAIRNAPAVRDEDTRRAE